jgi:hypothetical protein
MRTSFQNGKRLRAAILELLGPDRDYGGLEDAISRKTRVRISHRRLKRLVEKGNVLLSLSEFEALEAVAVGVGLGGLFLPSPSLLREIALARRVRFLVGTHILEHEQRSFCSFFDLLASMTLVEALERATDTPLSWELDQVAPIFDGVNREEARESGGATFSIGSSLSNPASECLLAECLSATPFCRSDGLPSFNKNGLGRFFSFVWNVEHPSAFGMSPEELEKQAPARIVAQLRAQSEILPPRRAPRGLLVGTEFRSEFEKLRETDDIVRWAYGILVARRSYGAFPRVIAAGLNGPSTYLITRMLAHGSLGKKLEPLERGETRTFYAVVRGRVTEVNEPGDNRRVDVGEVLYEDEVNCSGTLRR